MCHPQYDPDQLSLLHMLSVFSSLSLLSLSFAIYLSLFISLSLVGIHVTLCLCPSGCSFALPVWGICVCECV